MREYTYRFGNDPGSELAYVGFECGCSRHMCTEFLKKHQHSIMTMMNFNTQRLAE